MKTAKLTRVAIVEMKSCSREDSPLVEQFELTFFVCKTGLQPELIGKGFVDAVNADHALILAQDSYETVGDSCKPEELWPGSQNRAEVAESVVHQIGVTADGCRVFKVVVYGRHGAFLVQQPADPYWLCIADGSRILSVHSTAAAAWKAADDLLAKLGTAQVLMGPGSQGPGR